MTKKLFFLAALAIIFAACNNSTSDQNQAKELATVTCEEFSTSPDDYVGQEILIEGTAMHVCKHGGKRMFIAGLDPDERIKVTAGDDIAAFEVELEGSDVAVVGVVEELRVDEAYLTNWENEIKAETPESEMKIHTGEDGHEHGEGDVEAEFEQVNDLRAQLEESGKDHLSFYSIVAIEYKEKK